MVKAGLALHFQNRKRQQAYSILTKIYKWSYELLI